MVDLEPLKLSQTWSNTRRGETFFAKHLDRFLVFEYFLNQVWKWSSWVLVGGNFDHLPILLKLELHGKNLPSSLKFYESWLKEEEYISLIKNAWTHLKENDNSSYMHWFACNISKDASLSKHWAQFFNDKTQFELKEVETNIESLIVDKPMGSFLLGTRILRKDFEKT